MSSLRIIHLSDLHVGKVFVDYEAPSVEGFAAASKGAMERLQEAASRSDPYPVSDQAVCCIVSGDLTAFGHGQEFENALTYLGQGVGRREVGLHYHRPRMWDGLLGNHDIWGGRNSLLAWCFPGDKKKKAVKSSELPTEVRRGEFDLGAGLKSFIDVESLRVRFYFLDSTLPSWRNVFARGRIKLDDLKTLKTFVCEDEAFDRSTIKQAEYSLRIAVIHHPLSRPWNGSLLQCMVLENADEVLAVLDQLNFGLVLCGHEHGFGYEGRGTSGHFYELTAGTALQVIRGGGTNSFATIDIASRDIAKPNPLVMFPPYRPHVTAHFQKMTRDYQLGEPSSRSYAPTPATGWRDPLRIVQLAKE